MQARENIRQKDKCQNSKSSYDYRNKIPHRVLLEDLTMPDRQKEKTKKCAVLIWILLKGHLSFISCYMNVNG